MNYKLAKQLKEAGFLIKNQIWDKSLYVYMGKEPNERDFEREWNKGKKTYSPTLSELIDACEPFITKIFRIDFNIRTGKTRTWGAGNENIFFIGKTPEEAVAKLWLKLNK